MLIRGQQQRSEESLPSSIASRQNVLDILDRILDKGIVINGEIIVSLIDTEILSLRINLVIASIETAKRYGIELPWEKWQGNSKRLEVKEQNNKNKKHTTKTGNKVKIVE